MSFCSSRFVRASSQSLTSPRSSRSPVSDTSHLPGAPTLYGTPTGVGGVLPISWMHASGGAPARDGLRRAVRDAAARGGRLEWRPGVEDILIGKGERPVHLLPRYGNRHGLVAGATGTGKTISLLVMAEGFSRLGVPVFMADVKGDVAGLAMAGTPSE